MASHIPRIANLGMIVSLGTLGAKSNSLSIYGADKLVSTWVYLPENSPMFTQGYSINLGAGMYGLILFVLMILYI
jgi:hypothetical protein